MNKLLIGKVIKRELAICDFCGEKNTMCFATTQQHKVISGYEKIQAGDMFSTNMPIYKMEEFEVDICLDCVEELYEYETKDEKEFEFGEESEEFRRG